MWATIMVFLKTNSTALGALAAIAAILTFAGAFIKFLFFRQKPTRLAPEIIEQIAPLRAKDGPALTVAEFIRLRREFKADLEQEMAKASEAEKAELRARIAELESQIANPDEALQEAKKRIADLEALLDRAGNDIGGDRIAEAKAALEQGDYSVADKIFTEVEEKNDLAVQETARAAFGRGQVAEAEIRWHDAYKHYKRALDLHDTPDHLEAYARLCWRLAKGAEAVSVHERLVAWAKEEHGENSAQYAAQLGNLAEVMRAQGRYEKAEGLYREALEIDRATIREGHPEHAKHLGNLALVVKALGRYGEAEGLYRQALKIDRATLGEVHPDYARHLGNLAGAVQAQGRYDEAERLYRQTLKIDRATIGKGHPDYAIGLNNVASVVQAQRRYEEAEGLYREALEIDRATIREGHPEHAKHLGNLALVVKALGRYEEAEGLYREALKIGRATIGEGHPDHATRLGNLAGVVRAQGRYDEAEGLYRQTLKIDRATIGEGHPEYAIRLGNLGRLLGQMGRVDEARGLLEQSLAILRATLPPDHPHIATYERHLANLPAG